MAEFDARKQWDLIDTTISAAQDHSEKAGGAKLAAKFFNDAHDLFCSVKPENRDAVIAAAKGTRDPEAPKVEITVFPNGEGKPSALRYRDMAEQNPEADIILRLDDCPNK